MTWHSGSHRPGTVFHRWARDARTSHIVALSALWDSIPYRLVEGVRQAFGFAVNDQL